jgi:predicted DNA-binding transcriptional regulator AlpA
LTTRELLQWLTINRQTMWRLRHDGDFPAPVKLTAKRIAWSQRAVTQWIVRRKYTTRARLLKATKSTRGSGSRRAT